MVYKDLGEGPKIVICIHLCAAKEASSYVFREGPVPARLLVSLFFVEKELAAMLSYCYDAQATDMSCHHLKSYTCLQNCFLTDVFPKLVLLLWIPAVKEQCEATAVSVSMAAITHGVQNQLSHRPPPSSPEAKLNKCSTQSLEQIFPVPQALIFQVIFILQTLSKPSKDLFPHTYTSHTCSNSWYQPPTNLLPIWPLSFPRKSATSFPAPHVWLPSESHFNTATADWVN